MRGFDVNLLKVSFHITGVNNLATKQWGYTPQMLADRLQRDLSAGNVTQTFDLGMGAVRPVAVSLGQPTEPTKPTPEPTKTYSLNLLNLLNLLLNLLNLLLNLLNLLNLLKLLNLMSPAPQV